MTSSTSPEGSVALDPQELLRLASGVRIIALRSLGDADAAQDIVQETLARAMQGLAEGRLRDRRALGGFVRAIARHVIADELHRRTRVVPLDPEMPVAAEESDPLAGLVRAEQVAALRRVMRRLAPGDRRVIHLAFVDGLTPAAIAERLHEPRARVRKRKSRALERLREAFRALQSRHEPPTRPTLSVEGGAAPVALRHRGSSD